MRSHRPCAQVRCNPPHSGVAPISWTHSSAEFQDGRGACDRTRSERVRSRSHRDPGFPIVDATCASYQEGSRRRSGGDQPISALGDGEEILRTAPHVRGEVGRDVDLAAKQVVEPLLERARGLDAAEMDQLPQPRPKRTSARRRPSCAGRSARSGHVPVGRAFLSVRSRATRDCAYR